MKTTKFLASVVVLFVLVPIFCVFYGFVIMKLWSWFIATELNAKELTMAPATGIALVVVFFFVNIRRKQGEKEKKQEPPSWLEILDAILALFVWSAIMLINGWIIHQFI